jgi:uncharacterized protein
MSHKEMNPVQSSERHMILDILRGIALLGICLANYPEFSLYTFQAPSVVEAMPAAAVDRVIKFLMYLFIDGKFYTLFSLLFGIGFTLILNSAASKGNDGRRLFYRRMITLFFIGTLHLLCLWAGDILVLYALTGLLLPLFRKLSNRRLLLFSALFLLLPVLQEAIKVGSDYRFDPAIPVIKAHHYLNARVGIDDNNFGLWLVEKQHYADILRFNLPGSLIRLREFIDGHRFFKVLGLFLLGLYIGRNQLHADLSNRQSLLRKVRRYGFLIGLPTSLLYAWSAVKGQPLGAVIHSLLYAAGVVPMSLAYTAFVCLRYLNRRSQGLLFRLLAATGRLALTNYILQSVLGIILFYGVGFALGASLGLTCVEPIAVGIFLLQMLYSNLWMRSFRFGPLEWVWRMMIYGKRLPLRKQK